MTQPQSFQLPDGFVNAAQRLSRREFQTLADIAVGRSNQEISDEREVSVETIKTRLKGVYRKLDVRNRAEAVTYAYENGIVTPGYISGPEQQFALAWAEVMRSAPPPEKTLHESEDLSGLFESLELSPIQRRRALKWAERVDEGKRIIRNGLESIERQLRAAGFMAKGESIPEGLYLELSKIPITKDSPRFDEVLDKIDDSGADSTDLVDGISRACGW